MLLSRLYDLLKQTGNGAVALTLGQAGVSQALTYIYSYPLTSLALTTSAWCAWKLSRKYQNLPPGPVNLPGIGSVSFLQGISAENLLALRETYGDVIYLQTFGQEIVFLNSEKVLREAFLGMAQDFAYRDQSYFLERVGTRGDEIFTAPFNEKWKTNRKFATSAFKDSGFGTMKCQSKVLRELHKLEMHIQSYDQHGFPTLSIFPTLTTSLMLNFYLSQDLPLEDPFIAEMTSLTFKYNEAFEEGFFLCDMVLPDWPMMKEYACKGALLKGRLAVDGLSAMLNKLVKEHQDTYDSTEIRDITDYYRAFKKDADHQVIMASILIAMPHACATLGEILSWMLYLIVSHEKVQRKLRDEIDHNIGQTKEPTIADKKLVPYGMAIVLETFRYIDVFPLMFPRILKRDIEVGGYTIPQTAKVVGCLHSVHYDPGIFPDPAMFDPSRFIDSEGNLDQAMAGHVYPFGIGTRIAIGENYVKSFCFVTLIFLAQRYHLTFDPREQVPSCDIETGLRTLPPHKLCFLAR